MFRFILVLFALFLFMGETMAQTNDDLYFVFLNTNPDRATLNDSEAETIQAAHLQNIDKLAEEGKLFAAGPFKGGGGMFILHAESLDAAEGFLQTDPAIQSNRFNTEVFPFKLAYGDMCGYNNRIFMGEAASKKKNIVAQGYFNETYDGVVIFNAESGIEVEKIFKKHPSVKSGDLSYEVKTLWIAKGTFCD